MNRTTNNLSRQAGVVDRTTLRRSSGREIDWPNVSASRRESAHVIKLAAAAAIGATSLTTDATPVALPHDTFLKFGTLAPVTVTMADASVSAGDTSFTVSALTGPLPAGAVLDFSGGTNAQIAKLSAAALSGATSLTVYPLDGTIANSSTATFAGGTIGARLTADALKGATTLAVDELQFAIADDAEAIVGGTGAKALKALTIMAEQANGKLIPRADVTGAETATCVLETSASEDDVSNNGYGCLTAGALYENLMPDAVAGDVSGTYKTELAAAGCHFNFEDYGDNTTS